MTDTISLSTWIICYIATLVVFFAIDIAWLGLVAKDFYGNQLGSLMSEDVRWGVAVGFYAVYIIGILIFASSHGFRPDGSLSKAALFGALFGFFCYATYDLTNLATLEDWPVKMVVIDIIWGTVLTALCAVGGVWITRFFTG